MPNSISRLQTSLEQVDAIAESEKYAMSRGDMDQYAAILDDHAVFLPPNTTAKSGNELRAWLKDFLDHFEVEWLKWCIEPAVIIGDLAYRDYFYSMKSSPKVGGDPVVASGKGLELYRRDDNGNWKIVRNIWNSAPEPLG